MVYDTQITIAIGYIWMDHSLSESIYLGIGSRYIETNL